jgi:hypothetical protein
MGQSLSLGSFWFVDVILVPLVEKSAFETLDRLFSVVEGNS